MAVSNEPELICSCFGKSGYKSPTITVFDHCEHSASNAVSTPTRDLLAIIMIKEVLILTLFVACAYVEAQGTNPLAMMALMKSSTGTAGAGGNNMIMKMLNHPFRLCKETENVKMFPCRGNMMCRWESIKKYGIPNLMKCSPLGMGCCIKDFASLQMAKLFN